MLNFTPGGFYVPSRQTLVILAENQKTERFGDVAENDVLIQSLNPVCARIVEGSSLLVAQKLGHFHEFS